MFKEFKSFIMRGNVLDLAVAVIIGAAFGRIVSSLVTDIIMPPIGRLLGNIDFSNLFFNLTSTHYATLAEAQKANAATLNYGAFLNAIINFLVVALAIFFVVRVANRMKGPAPVTNKPCPFCKMSIAVDAARCPHCTSQLN